MENPASINGSGNRGIRENRTQNILTIVLYATEVGSLKFSVQSEHTTNLVKKSKGGPLLYFGSAALTFGLKFL